MRMTRPLAILLAITFFLAPTGPTTQAQRDTDGPLILVAVPGELGGRLAGRLQARLDGTLRGQRVERLSIPLRTEQAALRLGQRAGAALVVWAGDEADTLHNTPTLPNPFVPAQPVTSAITLYPEDPGLLTAYVRLTVGQAAALTDACEAALLTLEGVWLPAPAGWDGLGEAFYYRGLCHARQGSPEAAMADFATATALGGSWYHWHALAWGHFNLGEPRLALNAMDEAISLAPDRADLYLDRAYFHESQGEDQAAIEDYTAALTRQPDHAEAIRRRGEAHFRVGDFEAALADYNRLVSLRPDDPYALLGRAEVFLAREAYRAALDDLNAALALEPADSAPFVFARGLAHLYRGDYEAAVSDLERYTVLHPEDAAGWTNLGQAHEGLGQTFSAIQAFESALAADPAATHLHRTLARLYYEASGAFDPGSAQADTYLQRAITAATEALEAYAEDAVPRLYRALAYIAQSRYENALEDLNAAIRADPDFGAAYYNRAIVYTYLGEAALDDTERARLYHAAIEDYATLLQMDFSSYSYLLPYQGYLYVELGEFLAALDAFATYQETGVDTSQDQTFAYYQARAYRGLARYEEALDAYRAAIDGPLAYYGCQSQLAAGLILGSRLADQESAVAHLQAYLERPCTSNPVLKAALRLLLAEWSSAVP